VNDTTMVVTLALQAKVPLVLWGPPGTGKTSLIQSIGASMNEPVEVVLASVREPSDLVGWPIVKDGVLTMAPPRWARDLAEANKGIAFFDELSTAAPANQAGVLRIILDRVVGEFALPPTIAMAAAANPPERAAGGWELSPPLANRFWHGQWQVNAADWAAGAVAGFPAPDFVRLPPTWAAGIPAELALISSFIRHRPTLLLVEPESLSDAGKAWPSPRTWTMAATLLAAVVQARLPRVSGPAATALSGCVGSGPTNEFFAWVAEMDLQDPEEILANPGTFKLPARDDRKFATLAGVAAAVVSNATDARWLAGWRVLGRAAEHAKDVAVASARPLLLLAKARPELPRPIEEIKVFIPLLRAAGIWPKEKGDHA
jgi:hypothetical protein